MRRGAFLYQSLIGLIDILQQPMLLILQKWLTVLPICWAMGSSILEAVWLLYVVAPVGILAFMANANSVATK